MDYDELTLNPMLADIEAEVHAQETVDTKTVKRRYWTPKEEEAFYEIWGRENWRLTRHGKNTFYFGQWSEEMKERWNIEVKPEEVQCKVNQTKAKYRQVLKAMEAEKTNVTKWKKFDIVDRIVRNEYRPKDAEPIPPEALEKSREFSPLTQVTKVLPNSSINETLNNVVQQETSTQNQDAPSSSDILVVSAADGEPLNANLFNSDDSERTTSQYSNELFSDQIDEIKQEFKEEFNDEFSNYDGQDTTSFNQTEPQLTQLQTPQQNQQQYEQQQQHQQQQQQYDLQNQAHQQLEQHIQQLQQQQQQNPPQTYEQNVNSYATQNLQPPPPPLPVSGNPRSLLANNHYINNNGTAAPIRATQQYTANNYVATEGTPIVNNTSNNNSNSMPAPRANALNYVSQPRKRGRTPSVNIVAAVPPPNDTLETMYLEEVRKKNQILDEQKEISRKRLLLEERKIALMEQFFPKCLELQEKILQKLNSN